MEPSLHEVFPTGVGMARPVSLANDSDRSVPHGCGDGPGLF